MVNTIPAMQRSAASGRFQGVVESPASNALYMSSPLTWMADVYNLCDAGLPKHHLQPILPIRPSTTMIY